MTQGQKRLKILIVDDSPAVTDILAQLCELLGHDAICAEDGRQGLSVLEAESRIDLVFTDYKMPIMDGIEMAKRIRARYPNLPLVLITGSVAVTDAEIESGGFDAVVQKPFELKAITESIARFFPQRGKPVGRDI
jgi:CheY-like chemotaxis protein